jgi:hypothetical protein
MSTRSGTRVKIDESTRAKAEIPDDQERRNEVSSRQSVGTGMTLLNRVSHDQLTRIRPMRFRARGAPDVRWALSHR